MNTIDKMVQVLKFTKWEDFTIPENEMKEIKYASYLAYKLVDMKDEQNTPEFIYLLTSALYLFDDAALVMFQRILVHNCIPVTYKRYPYFQKLVKKHSSILCIAARIAQQ